MMKLMRSKEGKKCIGPKGATKTGYVIVIATQLSFTEKPSNATTEIPIKGVFDNGGVWRSKEEEAETIFCGIFQGALNIKWWE